MSINFNTIKQELLKVNIIINDIYDLVNMKKSYPLAIPILIDLVKEKFDNIRVKEGVIRALAVKEAVGKASPILINEYNNTPKEFSSYRWAIANSIYATMIDRDVENILPIILDVRNGTSRQMLVASLGKFKSEKNGNILIKLLEDDEVALHALKAIEKIKCIKAIEKIKLLTNHSNPIIKKQAAKTLAKLS